MVRFKNRYLLCNFFWEDNKVDPRIRNQDIYSAARESIGTNFGDFGTGVVLSSLSVKYWNPVTGLAIVRVTRDHFRMLWMALTLITHISSRKVKISVIHVAGTIRTCEKKIVSFITNWMAGTKNRIEKIRRELQATDMFNDLREIRP